MSSMPERIVSDLPFALSLAVVLVASLELTNASPAISVAGFFFISVLITMYVSWRGERRQRH